jgi:Intracellular proteinase inhibitor
MPPMHHAFRPSAERLEAHVLLSSVATALATGSSGSPIVETLTTDKTVYKVGQPIHIMLTVTNTTNMDVVLPNLTQQSGFTVSRDFKNIWKSKRARPGATPITLQPGQTHTVTFTWNGRPNVGSFSRSTRITGTVQVDNTLANNAVRIAIDPAHGKGSNAGVTDSMPNEVLTLTE